MALKFEALKLILQFFHKYFREKERIATNMGVSLPKS